MRRRAKIKQEKYPSAEMLLDIAIREYDLEENRKSGMETRAGVFLGFEGSLLVFSLTNLNAPSTDALKNVITKLPFCENVIHFTEFVPIISYCGYYLLLIIAIIRMTMVLSLKNYKILSYDSFDIENSVFPKDIIAVEVLKNYQSSLVHNKKENDIKGKRYVQSLKLLTLSLLMLVIFHFS
ncbi:hypothetical protein ACR6HW_07400 [Fusibacter sp. JL298sf-3]